MVLLTQRGVQLVFKWLASCVFIVVFSWMFWIFWNPVTEGFHSTLGNLRFDAESHEFLIKNVFNERHRLLHSHVAKNRHLLHLDNDGYDDDDDSKPKVCGSVEHYSGFTMCFQWLDTARVKVWRKVYYGAQAECYTVEWTPLREDFVATDCITMAGAQWYGGATLYDQRWPIQKQSVGMQPYLSGDPLSSKTSKASYGSLLERLFFTSDGFVVMVDEEVPLHVSINENGDSRLCLRSSYDDYKHSADPNSDERFAKLKYTVCSSESAKAAYQLVFHGAKFYETPRAIPDQRMFESPVWSTWARYKVDVTQEKVKEYAGEIVKNGFPNSQIEIDDMFSSHYGEFDFDAKKFPDAKQMIADLHTMGFRVTVWITPFANADSPAYREGAERGFWVKELEGGGVSPVVWWQGTGGLLDVTNPEAVAWYVGRLQRMKAEYGVDSFKFDAGEVLYVPREFASQRPLANPGQYTALYAGVVSQLGGQTEMRSGYRSQRHPVFMRMFDKDSKWGYDNGLRSMIPTALVMSSLGYHFILPDMIGGNAYGEEEWLDTRLPEKELFIRWTAVSACLPSMQFSVAPWQYDDETVAIAKKMVELHQKVIAPEVLTAAKETIQTGMPIIRPLWWVAPDTDKVAQSIDSEFMVGERILVAPILEQGVAQRDVYLPMGTWDDTLAGERIMVTGQGKWLKDYRIEIDQIGLFFKVPEE